MAEPLKNQFFQRPFFTSLAREIERREPTFSSRRFLHLLYDERWEDRELKARMRHASEALGQCLPSDYRTALGLTVVSDEPSAGPVRLEYVITYARPGGRSGQKVFQLKHTNLEPGQKLELTRKLSFADRSTRTHHPGRHTLSLVVNGDRVRTTGFSLVRGPK
jgi:hypothetical protein